MIQPLFLLELNELNFAFVQHYAKRGHLPTLSRIVSQFGLGTTTSEQQEENVEPWIQWVTAHTGKPFKDHGIHRLGDIVHSDVPQIWEVLEHRGVKVGAVSPMNAANRLSNPAFFIPDPWTRTKISADRATKSLYTAISKAVGENALGRLTPHSIIMLLRGFFHHVPRRSWMSYLRLIRRAATRPWLKAVVLDQLLAHVFINLTTQTRPQFASLFLNGGAHIQHHYMFNSTAYTGTRSNPLWYITPDEDPLLDIYKAYDQIVTDLMHVDERARIIVATGLHQEPHATETFYWRLRHHSKFLHAAGISFASVEPLMSRDFVVRFQSSTGAERAATALEEASLDDRSRLFEVDNRGDSLFCTLVFARDVHPNAVMTINGRRMNLSQAIAFVALKNGRHNAMGYLIDTASASAPKMPLSDVFHKVLEHFDTPQTQK